MSVNKLDEITELTRLGSRAAAAMIAGAPGFYSLFAHNSALVSSGEKAPLLNKLVVGPGEDPTGFLRECATIAWERKHPLKALFTPHVSARLAPAAVDLGFTPLGDTRLMVLQPETALTVSGDCTIQRAIGLPALETAATMVTRSLAPSANLPVDSFMRTLAVESTADEVGIFIGSMDGLPMGTVTAVRAGETVGLSRIATPQEFRRKGVGRALLAQVINLYSELGASRFYLSATEMGRPLYESLGFKTIGYCAVWQLSSSRTASEIEFGP